MKGFMKINLAAVIALMMLLSIMLFPNASMATVYCPSCSDTCWGSFLLTGCPEGSSTNCGACDCTQTCAQGCGAPCDDNGDCSSYCNVNTWYYDRSCNSNCNCDAGSSYDCFWQCTGQRRYTGCYGGCVDPICDMGYGNPCGANCDGPEDCPSYCDSTVWHYSRSCGSNCDCDAGSSYDCLATCTGKQRYHGCYGGCNSPYCDTGSGNPCGASCNQDAQQTGGDPNYCQACSNDADCAWNSINNGYQCSSADSCSGNSVCTHYDCSSGACSVQDGCTNCDIYDGWYGGGENGCGVYDDPTSYYRDYYCSGSSCTYSVTNSADYDYLDGWYGGGNTAGCGDDPTSYQRDYYVIADTGSSSYCNANSADCDGSDVCSNVCLGSYIYSYLDYYVTANTGSCTYAWGSYIEDCATKASVCTSVSNYRDYVSCSGGACTYNDYDSDSAQGYCDACKGAGYWYLGGEVSPTTCCEDAGENKVSFRVYAGYSMAWSAGSACCDSTWDNVNYNGACVAETYAAVATGYGGNDMYASPYRDGWLECDVWYGSWCSNLCGSGTTSGEAVGEYTAAGQSGCCGDDAGENVRTFVDYAGNSYGVQDWGASQNACCNAATDQINYNSVCVTSGSGGNAVATGYSGHDMYAYPYYSDGWLDLDGHSSWPAAFGTNVCGGSGWIYMYGDSTGEKCSTAGGSGCWDAGQNDYGCCGDDSGENYKTRVSYSDQVGGLTTTSTSDFACCDASTDCVYNHVCYAQSTWYDLDGNGVSDSYCYGVNGWLNADRHTSYCTANHWNIGGDADLEGDYYQVGGGRPDYCDIGAAGTPSTQCCCNDDTGENYRTCTDSSANGDCGADTTACCSLSTKCVDHNGACQATSACYTFGSGGLKSYCNSGTWEDPDEASGYCTASGCGYTWMTNVPTSGTRCCADDSTSDNSYYYSASPTTATSLTCERCNAGSYVGPTTLIGNGNPNGCSLTGTTSCTCYYGDITCAAASWAHGASTGVVGNGYYTGSLTTSTSIACYYGDMSCGDGSYANGASSTYYGNGYWTGSTCYYGDITCADNNAASGTSGSTLCTQAQGATCCPTQGTRAEGVGCADASLTGTSYDRDSSSARCIDGSSSGCSAYTWIPTAPACCGDDSTSDTFQSSSDGAQSCCGGSTLSDDTFCSSNTQWAVDGAYCSGTVRDSGSMSGTTLSGDDIVCGCDSSGTICDTNDADSTANGVCASSACTTALVAKSGATYYSSCTNGYTCDSNVNSGGTTPTFLQNGMCVSTSCCIADVASGETSSATWDSDEVCGCAANKDGQICDSNADSTWDGVCAYTGAAWICDTDTLFWDGTYYRTVRASDGSTDGKKCMNGAIGASGFLQQGYGLTDGTCDTVGLTAENCDSDGNAACAGTEPFYNTCDARTTYADACDTTITSGTSWSQTGTCINNGAAFPHDNTNYCDNAYEIVKSGTTYYNDCSDTGIADGTQCDSNAASGDYSPGGVCTGDNANSAADCSIGIVSKTGSDYIDLCGTDNYECDSDVDVSGYSATGSCQGASCCNYVTGPRTSGQTCDADTDCANYSATGTCYYGALGDNNDGDCLSACTCSFSTDTTCPIVTSSCTYGACDSTYCLDDSENICYYGNPTCSSGGWADKSSVTCKDPGTVSGGNCYYDNGGSVVRSNDCTVTGCSGISSQAGPSSCTSGAWADGAMYCWYSSTCYYAASDGCAADTNGWDYSSSATSCSAGVSQCCPTQGTRAESVGCSASGAAGTSYDRDTSSARCTATDTGCTAYTWMTGLTSGGQCCGDDAGSDSSYYNASSLTTATTASCERCNAGNYVAPATYYGNGYNSSSKTTETTITCYYGDITCSASSASNGISTTLYGNGYLSGSNCYYSDITCADNSIANGTLCIISTEGQCIADVGCLNSPSSLAISAPSLGSLFISWTDNSTVESGFRIERSTDNISFSEITTVSTNVVNYTNSGLANNTIYYYRVRAYYGGTNSGYTNVANKYTLPTNPVISSSSHTVNVCSNNTAIILTASATANHYHYVWDNSTGTSVTGSDTQWDGSPLEKTATASGNWYIHVISNNPEHASNPSSTVQSGPYVITKYTPTSSITSPEASSWQASNFSVSLTDIVEGCSSIDKCFYRVLNNGVVTKNWTQRTCSSSTTLTVGAGMNCAAEGGNNCTIESYSNDTIGQASSTVSRSFGIDYTLPIINANTISTLNPVYVASGDTIYVNYTYNEERPNNITIRIYGSTTINQTIINSPASGNVNRIDSILIPAGTADGTYNMSILVIDTTGNNMTNTQTDSVIVDNTSPTISYVVPNSTSLAYKTNGTVLEVNFSYTETNPRNYTITVYNTTTICSRFVSSGISSGTVAKSTNCTISQEADEGFYITKVLLYDMLNRSASITQPNAVQIDKTYPSGALNMTPSVSVSGTRYGKGTIPLNATASDNAGGSGVWKVEFYYNTTLIGTDYTEPYYLLWDTTTVPDGVYNITSRIYDKSRNYIIAG